VKAERILIADDTPANLALLIEALEPRGFEILTAASGEEALRIAERAQPDLVLLDIMMPGIDGYETCRELRRRAVVLDEADAEATPREVPVIFITARQGSASLVTGLRAGAVDYILKPFQADEVVARVEAHLKVSRLTRQLRERNAELEAEVTRRRAAEQARETADQRLSVISARETQRWGLPGFVGKSRHLARILADLGKLQHFGKTSVLVTGESGTGKELVARAIHHSSPRAERPFIPVNCVAIPAELAESLFFGHVRGAFTGATADRKGYFELADTGTLFLDEIGDMPLTLQAKLLRVLEDGAVTPVGSGQVRQVDVRVVAATNAQLPEKIAAGAFRQDLFFRLARYTVEMPPLRERPEDIPLLAAHFLEFFASETGRAAPPLTAEALRVLRYHDFPGNIRELKNALERALILCGGQPIEAEHLRFLSGGSPRLRELPPGERAAFQDLPLNLEAAEQALIQRALEQTGGNVVEAARLLGVNRSRIYRRFPQG
jgi:DNA-binding NtrC family response regulator